MIIAAGLFRSASPMLLSFLVTAIVGGAGVFLAYVLTANYRARRKAIGLSHTRCMNRLEALEKRHSDVKQAHLQLIKARVKLESRRYQAALLVDGVGLYFLMGVGQTCLWLIFVALYMTLAVAFEAKVDGVSSFFFILIVPAGQLGIAAYGALFGPGAVEHIDTLIALTDSQLLSVGVAVPERLELARPDPETAQIATAVAH
jgi:hypothetical protein